MKYSVVVSETETETETEMELHPPPCKSMISPTHTKFPANQPKISRRCSPPPLITRLKKSSYKNQDFQEYAKPWRLLPVPTKSQPLLYKLRLQTSNSYGSGLTDVNSGILLCLIDENGSSILQRLSVGADDDLRFERGAVDEFAFEGPRLGRIVAVWISLESGQWRMSGMDLRVIPPLVGQNNQDPTGLQYNFKLDDDILLGEKGEASMMELRPNSLTTFSGEDETLPTPAPVSNEESMKEYANLKLSLLFYDAVLVLAGSAVASVSIGGNAAYAFLIGGSLGFAYLILVQRSVDELPTPDVIGSEENGGPAFGGLKGSVLTAAGAALMFALGVVMLGGGKDGIIKYEAKDVIFGMVGFLMCKIAVVLAAFKPMSPTFGDNE